MLKNTSFYVIKLLLGIVLIASSLFFWSENKSVAAVLIGIGVSLVGSSLFYLYTRHFQQKNPNLKKQMEIEANDERNKMIQIKAKAKSADIIQWFILGLAYVMVLFEYPLWLFGITVGIFILYYFISICFAIKYLCFIKGRTLTPILSGSTISLIMSEYSHLYLITRGD